MKIKFGEKNLIFRNQYRKIFNNNMLHHLDSNNKNPIKHFEGLYYILIENIFNNNE